MWCFFSGGWVLIPSYFHHIFALLLSLVLYGFVHDCFLFRSLFLEVQLCAYCNLLLSNLNEIWTSASFGNVHCHFTSMTEIENARGIMDVLSEMLNALDPSRKEVHSQCTWIYQSYINKKIAGVFFIFLTFSILITPLAWHKI
jgi:hypothetical protein